MGFFFFFFFFFSLFFLLCFLSAHPFFFFFFFFPSLFVSHSFLVIFRSLSLPFFPFSPSPPPFPPLFFLSSQMFYSMCEPNWLSHSTYELICSCDTLGRTWLAAFRKSARLMGRTCVSFALMSRGESEKVKACLSLLLRFVVC